MTAAGGNLQEAIDACMKALEHDPKHTVALNRLTELTGDKWGATSVQSWKHCPLILQAKRICKHIGQVDRIHPTSFTSSYNTNHGVAKVTACTREFFQNLYDHVKQRDAKASRRSLLMRRETGSRNQQDRLLEEIAYTLNVSSGDQPQELKEEVARVQITPTHQGRRALVCFAQKWDGVLDSSHLLLHSKKTAAQGNAGGTGEGFKVAANSLLSRFSTPPSEPCTIVMVMNGRTWRFVYKEYEGSGIHQFVVEEYDTEVYGGLVVFIDMPISSFSLDRIWNPFHYVPTMPLATWTPLLPPGSATVVSYVYFLETAHLPSRVFRQGIYVGKIPGSTGIYFSEGGTVSVGRDRVDTSLALLELANLIEQRVKILPVGFKDYVVMERLMDNPMMLALLPRTIPPKQVYDSVESYIRRRDCVPESWDILLVDPRTAAEVGSHLRVEGVQATVHVVGVKAPLWTYHSQAELENAIMVEMFTQLSDGEIQILEVEKRILALISTESWVLGTWPGNMFKRFAGDGKRYVNDTKGHRKLVEATLFNDRDFFVGLCFDAWAGAGLDNALLAKAVGADRKILHNPNKMRNLVSCALQLLTAKEARDLLNGSGAAAAAHHGSLKASDQGPTVDGRRASSADDREEAGAAPNTKSGGSPVKKPIQQRKAEKSVTFA